MLRPQSLVLMVRRWKHSKTHWSVLQHKKFTKDRALDSFDDFYGSVYGNRWKSIRVALLSPHKYMALVNNFGDTERTIAELEAEGAINLRSIYNVAKDNLDLKNLKINQASNGQSVDQKLEQILHKQRQTEVGSIYPAGSEHPSQLNEETKAADGPIELQVDYKKSLDATIKEDSDIDYRRIIDPDIGTTGLHEFIPATKLKGMEDWILESDHYKYYNTTADFPIALDVETDFTFPENLNILTYEKGNVSDFIRPKRCVTGVSSHFLMDGGSILPPLALNIQPGDRILDACAAPGGKSLLMLQTLYPDILVCNDVQQSRVNRINKLLKEFVYDFEEKWIGKRVVMSQEDARCIAQFSLYDKILVDVPCTTDRHSVMQNDNNIFKSTRLRERMQIPELQSAILANCLRLLKPGGSLVYSTCSLSPVQNDGVVHMALSSVFSEHNITCTIKNLSLVMAPFSDIFKFQNPRTMKYGQMVVPYLPANFGPMYFCKLVRN